LRALRGVAATHAIAVSDRRWRQFVGLLRTVALTEGRSAVDAWDLWLAPYALAREPAQIAPLERWFADRVAQAVAQDAPWLTHAVEAFERQLGIEQSAQSQPDDGGAGKIALARAIGGAQETGMLRVLTESLEAHLRKRYSPAHRDARVAQVDEVLARAQAHIAPLQAQADATARALAGRLWLPPDLAAALRGAQQQTLAVLRGLEQRLRSAREGFADLPLDERAEDAVPAPISLTA
jgi:MoxR-like ATPase